MLGGNLGISFRALFSSNRCEKLRAFTTGQSAIEKIVQRYAADLEPGKLVRQGDFVKIRPAYVMTHDNTSPVIKKFLEIGAKRLYNNKQLVFALDHDIQNKSEANLKKYALIEKFARDNNIDFYGAGRGIGHQVLVEEGYAYPGTLVVASDSHSNMYGGVGCLGTPVVRTDAAAIWTTGSTWWQVPPVVKVEFVNRLRPGVTGKDIIITLCGEFNKDEVLNCAIEFHGENGISNLSVDERLAIANMTTEWGALAGLFPIDDILIDWLKNMIVPGMRKHHTLQRLQSLLETPVNPDDSAFYAKTIKIDLSTIYPSVSGPNTVKNKTSVYDLEAQKIKIDKAYIVSCVNSSASDIKVAADVLKGKKIAEGVELYIAPASSVVQEEVEKAGYWDVLRNAGARFLPAGCGPCIGLGAGLLKDGEVGISATNRNYKGRMGSPNALTYLASPEIVAASALNGYISHSNDVSFQKPKALISEFLVSDPPSNTSSPPKLFQGFDPYIEGRIVFCNMDNLNTDGIYPGKYTYQDDMTADQMAKVVMENYDMEFAKIVSEGDILVSGFNFGTGSSREQAVVALLCKGIRLVLCGSFSDIYKRNAINNGLIVVEAPQVIQKLRTELESGSLTGTGSALTLRTNWTAKFFLIKGTVSIDTGTSKSPLVYSFAPIGEIAQELIVAGGLESWAKKSIGRIDA